MDPPLHPASPPDRSAIFPYWRETLACSRLPRGQRGRFAIEIGRFLRYCEILAEPPSTSRARTYLARIPLSIHRPFATQALRWFFRAARRPRLPPAPPPPYEPWGICSPLPEDPELPANCPNDNPISSAPPQPGPAGWWTP